jgi:hypothetical protein
LLLSSVLHSQQIPHSLSTEAAVTAAAEAAVTAAVEAAVTAAVEAAVTAAAVSMVAVVAVFIAAAEASMVAADPMAVAIAGFVAAASMAARGLLAEEVATKAAGWEPAAVQAHREIGRRQIGRRIFGPPSTMASGIRSATRVVPRVPAQGAIPEARPTTQASPFTTPEVPTDVGILLARQAALRNEEEARPISAYPSAGASVAVVMVGEAVGGVTIGTADGAGEVGASASAGRTGVFIGDRPGRLAGILGGTALTGMARGRVTLTFRITVTTGPTIRRRTGRIHPRVRPMTATRRQTT